MMLAIKPAIAFSLLLASNAVAAPILQGSYTAISTVQTYGPGGFTTQNNVPTGGTFSIDTSRCHIRTDSFPIPTCFSGPGDVKLMISYGAGTIGNGYPQVGGVEVINTPTTQTLYITPIAMPTEGGENLILVGPANAFINGIDFQSLHAGPVDLAASYASGGFPFGPSVYGSLTSITFTAVPEPMSVALLGVAVAAMAARRRLPRLRTDTEPSRAASHKAKDGAAA